MTNKSRGYIGVFDSGFGGLNILKHIVKVLPDYDYIYLGDTARTPYGNRSPEVIYEFTKQAVDFLVKKNCQLIILACNTASSDALRKIQQEYLPKKYPEVKVLGVLIPATEEAVLKTTNKKVGVIATTGTVSSGAFIRELLKLNKDLKVFQQSCPLLVPLIEEGEYKSLATKIILEKYLQSLQRKKVDTLILGCTHYGILQTQIKKIMGQRVKIINEGPVVAGKLKNYLRRHLEIEAKLSRLKRRQFYTTDLTEKFVTLGSKFFGQPIKVEKVNLD